MSLKISAIFDLCNSELAVQVQHIMREVFDILKKIQRVCTVLSFLGSGTGVSAVPAGVPLVSSADCWEGVAIFTC